MSTNSSFLTDKVKDMIIKGKSPEGYNVRVKIVKDYGTYSITRIRSVEKLYNKNSFAITINENGVSIIKARADFIAYFVNVIRDTGLEKELAILSISIQKEDGSRNMDILTLPEIKQAYDKIGDTLRESLIKFFKTEDKIFKYTNCSEKFIKGI